MPNRVVEFEPYLHQFRPTINPLKSQFRLYLNRVDQEIDVYSAKLPIYEERDDCNEIVTKEGISPAVFRLLKSIIIEYQKLKTKACRKIDYFHRLTCGEQKLFDQELAKLEYFGACIIEFRYYRGIWELTHHPILRLQMPVSVWSKVRLKSIVYDPNTYRLQVETKDPLTIISRPLLRRIINES